jgi:hypothetical protein
VIFVPVSCELSIFIPVWHCPVSCKQGHKCTCYQEVRKVLRLTKILIYQAICCTSFIFICAISNISKYYRESNCKHSRYWQHTKKPPLVRKIKWRQTVQTCNVHALAYPVLCKGVVCEGCSVLGVYSGVQRL